MAKALRSNPGGTRSGRLEGRLKGWLVWDGDFLMGPRYVRLLEGIQARGSVRAAAALAGVSYRTCLNRLRRMERVLGGPIVTSSRGGAEGGSTVLSQEGRELIRIYRRWRKAVDACHRAAWAEVVGTSTRDRR